MSRPNELLRKDGSAEINGLQDTLSAKSAFYGPNENTLTDRYDRNLDNKGGVANRWERAARAIYETRNGPGCKPWGHLPRSHKEPYRADARAALAAADIDTKDFDADDLTSAYMAGVERGKDLARTTPEPSHD